MLSHSRMFAFTHPSLMFDHSRIPTIPILIIVGPGNDRGSTVAILRMLCIPKTILNVRMNVDALGKYML